MAEPGLKENVWKVFWGCLAILGFIFVFFTYNASAMTSEEGVVAEDVFVPFAVLNWMYTPSSPVFGFNIFLSGMAILCILALQFYPGFQKQTLAVKIKNDNNNQGGGGRRRR